MAWARGLPVWREPRALQPPVRPERPVLEPTLEELRMLEQTARSREERLFPPSACFHLPAAVERAGWFPRPFFFVRSGVITAAKRFGKVHF